MIPLKLVNYLMTNILQTGDEITETDGGGTLSYEPPSELPPPPPTLIAGGFGKPSLPNLDIPTENDAQNCKHIL